MARVSYKIIGPIIKSLNLKAVKKMAFTFDPYHPRVLSIRELLFCTNSPKTLDTNLDVVVKVNVKSDRSDPVFDVTFVDDSKAIFKTKNLTLEDILPRFHKMCEEKNPKEEESFHSSAGKPGKKRR